MLLNSFFRPDNFISFYTVDWKKIEGIRMWIHYIRCSSQVTSEVYVCVCVCVFYVHMCAAVYASMKARGVCKGSLALELSTHSFEIEPLAVPQDRLTASKPQRPSCLPPMCTASPRGPPVCLLCPAVMHSCV